jgi:hypothetical protein
MSARAARWKIALDAFGGARRRGRVGDVALDQREVRIARVLAQVLAPADHETVEHAHGTAIRDQAIDQMASDETRSAGDKIDAQYATPAFPHPRLWLVIGHLAPAWNRLGARMRPGNLRPHPEERGLQAARLEGEALLVPVHAVGDAAHDDVDQRVGDRQHVAEGQRLGAAPLRSTVFTGTSRWLNPWSSSMQTMSAWKPNPRVFGCQRITL